MWENSVWPPNWSHFKVYCQYYIPFLGGNNYAVHETWEKTLRALFKDSSAQSIQARLSGGDGREEEGEKKVSPLDIFLLLFSSRMDGWSGLDFSLTRNKKGVFPRIKKGKEEEEGASSSSSSVGEAVVKKLYSRHCFEYYAAFPIK